MIATSRAQHVDSTIKLNQIIDPATPKNGRAHVQTQAEDQSVANEGFSLLANVKLSNDEGRRTCDAT